MKRERNLISMTFYNGETRRLFMEFVDTIPKGIRWVELNKITWTHAMVYERKTRATVARVVNQNGVPKIKYY